MDSNASFLEGANAEVSNSELPNAEVQMGSLKAKIEAKMRAVFNFGEEKSRVRVLIKRLAYGFEDKSMKYYIDFVKDLPVSVNVNNSNLKNGNAKNNTRSIKTIKGKIERKKQRNILKGTKKSGSWGTVHFGNVNVYKEIRTNNIPKEDLNDYCRDVLTELFIQIVLNCDNTHGDKVPEIYGVYKIANSDSLWIHMEKYDETFKDHLFNTRPTFEGLAPYFEGLSSVLEHFQKRYKFNHRDMKPDNLMVKKNPGGDYSIKLIDFGQSIIVLEGVTYSGTLRGGLGYTKQYFSESMDIIMMCLYFLDIMPAPMNIKKGQVNSTKLFLKRFPDFVKAKMFFKYVVENNVNDPTYSLTKIDIIKNVPKSVSFPIKKSMMTSPDFKDFKGASYFFQTASNFNGSYFNGQVSYPNSSPARFIEIYNAFLKGEYPEDMGDSI